MYKKNREERTHTFAYLRIYTYMLVFYSVNVRRSRTICYEHLDPMFSLRQSAVDVRGHHDTEYRRRLVY